MSSRYLQVPLSRDVLGEFESALRAAGQTEKLAVLEALGLYAEKHKMRELAAAVTRAMKRTSAEGATANRREVRALEVAMDLGALDDVIVPDGTPGSVKYAAEPEYAAHLDRLRERDEED